MGSELEVSLLKRSSVQLKHLSFKEKSKQESRFFLTWLRETPSCFCWHFPKIVPRWACLLGFFLLFLVLFVLIFFVAFPLTLKSLSNDMTVEFENIMMYNAQIDRFSMNATAKLANSPMTCTIGAMKAQVLFNSQHLGYIDIPQIELDYHKSTTVFIQTDFIMTDSEIIDEFIREFTTSTTPITWTLKGKADVYTKGVAFNQIEIEKQISIPGLNGLGNSSILGFSFPENGPDNSILAFVNASIANPSIIGFDFGNITLGAYYNSSFLGACTTFTPLIKPGNNTLDFHGYIKPSNISIASRAASKFAAGEKVSLHIKGIQIGNQNISWIKSMAESLEVFVEVGEKENLTLIKEIGVELLNLSFVSNSVLQAGANVTAKFDLPKGFLFPFELFSITLDVIGYYENTAFITVSVPWSPAQSNYLNSTLKTGFEQAPFSIINEDIFVKFISKIVEEPLINATVSGIGNGKIKTNVGIITLENIKAHTDITIEGLNNFSSLPIEILDLDILEATQETVSIQGSLLISNPLYLQVFISKVPLEVYLNGTLCGNVSAEPFQIFSKTSSFISAKGILDQSDPISKKNIEYFLSNYAGGKNSTIQVKGIPSAEPIDILKNALGNITATFEIPPLQSGLIYYVEAFLDPYYNIQGKIPAKLFVQNPWNVNLFVTGIEDGKVFLADTKEQVISLNVSSLKDPILVKPSSRQSTPKLIGEIVGLSIEELKALEGPIKIDLIATMHASIGGQNVDQGFKTTFKYSQVNVSASFWPPDGF